MRRTGPNDDRHVIWALGELFLSFFRLFLILTKDLNYLQVLITKRATSEIGSSLFEEIEGRARVFWQEKLSKIEIDVGGSPRYSSQYY